MGKEVKLAIADNSCNVYRLIVNNYQRILGLTRLIGESDCLPIRSQRHCLKCSEEHIRVQFSWPDLTVILQSDVSPHCKYGLSGYTLPKK